MYSKLNIANFFSSPQYIYAFHAIINVKDHYFRVKIQSIDVCNKKRGVFFKM